MNLDINSFSNYKRINVLGSPGAGKSTFSDYLSQCLEIWHYDLDDYLYDAKCKRLNNDDSMKAIHDILNNESFIIDGTYTTTLNQRLKKLDLVVLIDRNTLSNLFTFAYRFFTKKNLKCGERFTKKTIRLIFSFNNCIKQKIITEVLNNKVKLAIYIPSKNELKWIN